MDGPRELTPEAEITMVDGRVLIEEYRMRPSTSGGWALAGAALGRKVVAMSRTGESLSVHLPGSQVGLDFAFVTRGGFVAVSYDASSHRDELDDVLVDSGWMPSDEWWNARAVHQWWCGTTAAANNHVWLELVRAARTRRIARRDAEAPC